MNLQALKAAAEQLKTGGGAEGFFSTKILTEEGVPIRLLPEPPILAGIPYYKVVKYWMTVNGKRTTVICCSSFPGPDGKMKPSIIEQEINEARDSDDADVQSVINDTGTQTNISRDEEFWMAALQLQYDVKDDGSLKIKVVDGRAKVFQCSKATLVDQIIKAITSGKAVRAYGGDKTPDGCADRVKGLNVLCSKTGSGKLTRYAAVLDEQCEMDPKYYINIPNVYEIAKAQMPNPSWQQAAIRNHIYGEPIPDDIQAKEDARKEKVKLLFKAQEAEAAKALAALPVAKKKSAAPVEEDEEETPKATAPKKSAAPTKKAAPIDDDLEEDLVEEEEPAEEEEDETPAPVSKKAVKKAAPIDLDEDELPVKSVAKKKAQPIDEDPEEDAPKPVASKKAAIPPPPASKKATPPKRTLLDLLEDDE